MHAMFGNFFLCVSMCIKCIYLLEDEYNIKLFLGIMLIIYIILHYGSIFVMDAQICSKVEV